jgi:phenylacetate-coenzyme A ligase PaaK-like adenylate-forming protein
MSYRSKLFRSRQLYDTVATEDLFWKAIRENCHYQYEHCESYRKILDHFDVKPDLLREYKDIERLPFLPTLIFKHHRLFSMPKWRRLITATSSGTKGKFSEIGFETSGLLCGLRMVIRVSMHRRILSIIPCHYVIFGYKPHKSNKTAVTKTAMGSTLFTPALSRTFALHFKDGKYQPDLEGIILKIQKRSRSRFPMRLVGFPSYTFFMLKMMDEKGIYLTLHKGSKILLGGGWKQFYAEQVDKQTFYDLAKKVLGIDDEDIVEFFGAVEHPVLYCDCKNHHFHVPVYGRVVIRDVSSLKPVENGRMGLVNLITPMVKATPILSVMTDDLGVLHEGSDCGCGATSPYLEIIGRVGLQDIKTCAAGAADLLSQVKL